MAFLFVIQSHKNPDQLARLVRVLRAGCPDSDVLISHDFRATPLSGSEFGGDSRVHLIEGKGGRGDFEIVDGYLAALAWARENLDYDWVTNLSGQDYPVFPLAEFADILAGADHDGFLHHFDAMAQRPGDMRPMAWPPGHGYDRYCYQYVKLKESLSKPERAVLRLPRLALERVTDRFRINTAYGLLVGRHAEKTPFGARFRCYAGSYWHTIRRSCADHLLDFAEAEPQTVDYLRKVLIPDECFVQTVLANEPRFRFTNDNRRYYDMRNSRRGHPKVLTQDDVREFINERYFFARKFEPSSGQELFNAQDEYALSQRPAKRLLTRPATRIAPAL